MRWPALATALVASVANPESFPIGTGLLGLGWTGAQQNSNWGKQKLGGITKPGDGYLRSLFTTGALAAIRYAKIHGKQTSCRGDRAIGTPANQGHNMSG